MVQQSKDVAVAALRQLQETQDEAAHAFGSSMSPRKVRERPSQPPKSRSNTLKLPIVGIPGLAVAVGSEPGALPRQDRLAYVRTDQRSCQSDRDQYTCSDAKQQ